VTNQQLGHEADSVFGAKSRSPVRAGLRARPVFIAKRSVFNGDHGQ